MGAIILIIATIVALLVFFVIVLFCFKWKHTIKEPYRQIFWIFTNQIVHDQFSSISGLPEHREFESPKGHKAQYNKTLYGYLENHRHLLKYLGRAYGWKMYEWKVGDGNVYFLIDPCGLQYWCYYYK